MIDDDLPFLLESAVVVRLEESSISCRILRNFVPFVDPSILALTQW